MRAMVFILGIVLALFPAKVNAAPVVIPPMPQVSPETMEAEEWIAYEAEAFDEYADEFDALFNSLETKWSKNGRLMMRQGNSGSFRFVKRAA